MDDVRDKNILVIGAGKSGIGATTELHNLGAVVTIQDSKSRDKIDKGFLEFLASEDISSYFGELPPDMGAFDIIVLSPGVPTDLPFINEARDKGVEVIGELEMAYRLSRGTYVAITGTNGKTTTTTLVGDIFENSGRKTSVVGNIGLAVITRAVNSTDEDWLITEASSFQLESTVKFRPVVSAILNLTPDHLNRHKTMEAYGQAKANIFMNQTPDNYLIVNGDDEATMALVGNCQAKIIPFSRKKTLDVGAYLDGDMMVLRDEAGDVHEICNIHELKIIGDHNIENALAAAAVSYFAGIGMDVISESIREFPGVEHRIEFCGEIDGVKYYNDSKGTNVDASVIALKALRNNIILIAGGDGKAQDFTDLAKNLEGRVKSMVLLGRDAGIIADAAKAEGFAEMYFEPDMEHVVAKCAELAEPGDKVLLSPACASWDMYPSYEVRGEHFKNCVDSLRG